MKKKIKIRADELVLKLGLCESRTQAQACILAGKVKLGTEKLTNPDACFLKIVYLPWKPHPSMSEEVVSNWKVFLNPIR